LGVLGPYFPYGSIYSLPYVYIMNTDEAVPVNQLPPIENVKFAGFFTMVPVYVEKVDVRYGGGTILIRRKHFMLDDVGVCPSYKVECFFDFLAGAVLNKFRRLR
jgi:hypothetical protein